MFEVPTKSYAVSVGSASYVVNAVWMVVGFTVARPDHYS